MKRFIYMIIAAAAITVSCNKEVPQIDYRTTLTGEWHGTVQSYDADIYLSFNEDGSFDLYQRIGEGRHEHFTGTWKIDGKVLSGTYSNGDGWGSSYELTFVTEDAFTTTALNGSGETVSYTREAIPSEVMENSLIFPTHAELTTAI